MLLGEQVTSVSPTRVTLKSGRELKAHTLVWGAGLHAHPIAESIGIELERGGRIPVGPELAIDEFPNVYAVGDIAWITDGPDGEALPQLGSVALQSGEKAGENIARRIAGKEQEPFSYHDKGTMATIGRGRGCDPVRRWAHDEGQDRIARMGGRAPRASVNRRGPDKGDAELGLGRASPTSDQHASSSIQR